MTAPNGRRQGCDVTPLIVARLHTRFVYGVSDVTPAKNEEQRQLTTGRLALLLLR